MLSLANILQITRNYNKDLKWFQSPDEGGNIFLITKLSELKHILSLATSHFLTFLFYKGFHWTVLAINHNKALYIDSFGTRIHPNIIQILADNNVKYIYSSILQQQYDSINCGLYASLNILSIFEVIKEYTKLNKQELAKKLIIIKNIDMGKLRKKLTEEGVFKNLD